MRDWTEHLPCSGSLPYHVVTHEWNFTVSDTSAPVGARPPSDVEVDAGEIATGALSPPAAHGIHQVADGTARIFLAEALLLPAGLVIAIYLTRRLGPEQYGLYTLAATLIVWLGWGTAPLLSRATIKLVSEAHDWRPVAAAALRVHLVCGLGLTILVAAAAAPIAALLSEPRLTPYIRLFALELLPLNIARAHHGVMVGTGRVRQQALVSAVRWPAGLLFIVLLVEAGLSVSGAILGSIAAMLLEVAVYRRFVRPGFFARSTFPVRRLWSYATPLFLSALCIQLFTRMDLFALSALGGTAADAGRYGAAQNLSVIPGLFALSFSPLLLSTLGGLRRTGEWERARMMGRDAMRLVIGMLPFAGMAAGAAPEVVALIYGPAFALTAPVLALVIFAEVALVMISVATAIMVAAERPNWTFVLTGPLLLVALAGHALLIPRVGAVGAALVTTTVAGAGALAAVAAVYYLWRVLPPLGTAGRSALLCGLAYLAAASWSTPGLWVVPKLLMIILAIPLAFLLLGELDARERASVLSVLRGRVRT